MKITHRPRNRLRLLPAVIAGGAILLAMVNSCTIEPPLVLADPTQIQVTVAEVKADINVIWDIEPNWKDGWLYGWDQEDIDNFGEIAYPDPSNFEVRIYHRGESPDNDFFDVRSQTVYGKTFRRYFEPAYYDMLLWSNIDSKDGTQVLLIDEKDKGNIKATTTETSFSYNAPATRGNLTGKNNPEIFYAGNLNGFYISPRFEDYDYFDQEKNIWVKTLHTELNPLVYIYLVQVIIHNNKDRIIAITDNAGVSNMAEGVSVHTGHTSESPTVVGYPMRLKKGLKTPQGEDVDIFGGKLTTFGLTDMDSWARSRSRNYQGRNQDLKNHLMVNLRFSNYRDSTYGFDVTKQVQSQAHGGILTVEIDADTLKPPKDPTPSDPGTGTGFLPTVEEYGDSIEHEFGL